MTLETFKEEMSPATCDKSGGFFFANLGKLRIMYDSPMFEFYIYKGSELLLDQTDLRTAKAFIKMETEDE